MPSLLQKLNDLRSDLAQAVQLVVDEWELNEDGFSDDLGSGGVCDLVSEAMSGVIYDKIDSVEILDGGHDGDDHAWIIVVSSTEAVGVNIPPGVYETGGGYSWKKIENITVEPSDISLWEINRKDVEERTDRIAANWSYEDKFVFQGRVYDMKIRGSDSQGAVVYQKSPKCLFGKDGDEWFFQAGSRTLFDAAMRHLKRDKVAADSDDLEFQKSESSPRSDEFEFPTQMRYHPSDKDLEQLRRMAPLRVHDIKQKHPALFSRVKFLLRNLGGGLVTTEIVDRISDSLERTTYELTTNKYHGDWQRSISYDDDSENPPERDPQITLVVLADSKLKQDLEARGLWDLFRAVNLDAMNHGSYHPSAETALGFARLEIDPEGEFVLIDELQSDHESCAITIKKLLEDVEREWPGIRKESRGRIDNIVNTSGIASGDLAIEAAKLGKHLKHFENIVAHAVSVFAKHNGFSKLYWHTYHGGMKLKPGSSPPRRVYEDAPEANNFTMTPNKPFDLPAEFWNRAAALTARVAHRIASDHDGMRLQLGPAFHLQPDGTWAVEAVPSDVVREARFSGFLAIEGYWCAVFDTGGQTWAQKAAGDIPEIETKLSSIARRVARLHLMF